MKEDEHLVGEITGFASLPGSGIATIFIDDEPVLCENAPTARALESVFGNVIGKGYSIDVTSIVGQAIVYSINSYGLLEWFQTLDPEDLDVEDSAQSEKLWRKSSALKCASCDKLLDGIEDRYTGDRKTYYEGKLLCECCYYESARALLKRLSCDLVSNFTMS